MDIGTVVTEARTRAGLTQQELARRAGTSQSAVARIESGRGQPGFETARRLVAAAGFELQISFAPPAPARDAVVDAYKAGIDRSLLRENLSKSVDRRLRDMESFRESAAELRSAVKRAKRHVR
jgi:transcriptional regulator with XRE-family HTH domain